MAILGSVVTIESDSATLTFVCVVVFLVWLDEIIHLVESTAKKSGHHEIFHKVNKEMMILGLVSFATFVIFEAVDPSGKNTVWFHAFEFAHILVLFIALAFVIQALLLTKFVSTQRKRLYKLFHVNEEMLVSKYKVLAESAVRPDNSWKSFFMQFMYYSFHKGPLWFDYPPIRDAMVYKIIEEFFIRSFYLPEQFHFAEYMSRRFKAFVFELVEVHPLSWFVLVLLAACNYGRIQWIDPIYQAPVCDYYSDNHADDHADDGHRMLTLFSHIPRLLAAAGDDGSHHVSPGCDQYTLRVIFIYAVILSLYIYILSYFSNKYMTRHIKSAMMVLKEPCQSNCEQHVPFHPELDQDAEFKATGYTRALFQVCVKNIAAERRREKEIAAVKTLLRLQEDEEMLRLKLLQSFEISEETVRKRVASGSISEERVRERTNTSSSHDSNPYAGSPRANPINGEDHSFAFPIIEDSDSDVDEDNENMQPDTSSDRRNMLKRCNAMYGKRCSNFVEIHVKKEDSDDSRVDQNRLGSVASGHRIERSDSHNDVNLNNFQHAASRGHNLKQYYSALTSYRKKGGKKDINVSENSSGNSGNSHDSGLHYEFKLENDNSNIFMWRSRWLYRLSLEIGLLLQCFYIAIWATQIIVVAWNTEHYSVWWSFALTIPMFVNFLMLSDILFLSCTLEAVSFLNLKDSGAICEDAIVKEEAIEKFRTAFRQKLVEMTEIPKNERRKFVREKLKECEYIDEDPDDEEEEEVPDSRSRKGKEKHKSGGYYITYHEFRNFLLKFHIHMSERSFATLCLALDKTHRQSVERGHAESETNSHHESEAESENELELDSEGAISVLFVYHKIFPEVAVREARKLAEKRKLDEDAKKIALKSISLKDNSADEEHLMFKRKPSNPRLRGTDVLGAIGENVSPAFGSSTNLRAESRKDKDKSKSKKTPAWKRMFGHKQSFSNEVEVVVDGNVFGVSSSISGISVQDRINNVATNTSGTQLKEIQPDIENNIELKPSAHIVSANSSVGNNSANNSGNKRFSVRVPPTYTLSIDGHATNIGNQQLVKQISGGKKDTQ